MLPASASHLRSSARLTSRARSPTSCRGCWTRWTPSIEEAWRAAWREEEGRLVPSGSPSVTAAVEHGMAEALPSSARPARAAIGLPVLLVASEDGSEEDLARFAADVPQAEIHRAEGASHDVLADGGPALVELVADWLAAND